MSQTKQCSRCKRHLDYDDFYGRERGYNRTQCKECCQKISRKAYDRQKKREEERGLEGELTLDSRPFCQWLRELYEQEKHAAEYENPGAAERRIRQLAMPQVRHRTGMSERRLYEFLYDRQSTVHIDTVDKALVAEGRTDHVSKMRELYPALYDAEKNYGRAA